MPKEKKEYKKFRDLLRGGIGSRTQKAFAKEAGISAEHLSRMLNQPLIFQPTLSTLRKLADHMESVSLGDLMEACGYELEDAEKRAVRFNREFEDMLERMKGEKFPSAKAVADHLRQMADACEPECRLFTSLETPGFQDGKEQTANLVLLRAVRKTEDFNFITCAALFLGHIMDGVSVQGYEMDSPEFREKLQDKECFPMPPWDKGLKVFLSTFVVREKGQFTSWMSVHEGISPENRLMAAIFGGMELLPVTITGFGFYYPNTPSEFLPYLFTHASSFCTDMRKAELYQKIIDGGDAGKLLEEYYDDAVNDVEATGMAVAEIMTMESGYEFRYLPTNKMVGDPSREDSCIMTEAYKGPISKAPAGLTIAVYKTAQELEIPEFGECYYLDGIEKRPIPMFKTDEYHIEFNCKEDLSK